MGQNTLRVAAPARRPRRPVGSLSEQAYLAIRERILHGDLMVGTALSRRGLASELSISPVPVMEALQRLESEGLIESRPRVGTRVRVPSPEDIRDQFILREALETHSARLFAEKASAAERVEVMRMAMEVDALDEQINRAHHVEDSRELLVRENRLHQRLHFRIAECSGCRALVKAIGVNQTLIFKWLLDMIPRLQRPAHWHRQLIEAISASDPAAAEAAMREHVRHGLDNVARSIEEMHGL